MTTPFFATDIKALSFPLKLKAKRPTTLYLLDKVVIESGNLNYPVGESDKKIISTGQVVDFVTKAEKGAWGTFFATLDGFGISAKEAKGAFNFETAETPAKNTMTEQQSENVVKGVSIILQGLPRVKIFSTLGFLSGLVLAYHKKSSVGGFIGYALLFSFIGSIAAFASVKIVPPLTLKK
jgi:hypothetical protein